VTPISAVVCSTSTQDPSASIVTLPLPTLHLVFGGDHHGDFALAGALEPRSSPDISSREAAAVQGPAYCPIDRGRSLLEHPHRIELSIDSLPNFMLIEPIPVAIDPVGDNAFTAWVPNLDTNATGSTVIEALLMLKERIEFVYDELNKRQHLTNEQKMTLQILHTYIAPSRPEWV
jgi:hypothetical protein